MTALPQKRPFSVRRLVCRAPGSSQQLCQWRCQCQGDHAQREPDRGQDTLQDCAAFQTHQSGPRKVTPSNLPACYLVENPQKIRMFPGA